MRITTIAGLMLLFVGFGLVAWVMSADDRVVRDVTITVSDDGAVHVLQDGRPVRCLRRWDVAPPAAGVTYTGDLGRHRHGHRRRGPRIEQPLTIASRDNLTVTQWAVECRDRRLVVVVSPNDRIFAFNQPDRATVNVFGAQSLHFRSVMNGFTPDGDLTPRGSAEGGALLTLIALVFIFAAANLTISGWNWRGAVWVGNAVAMLLGGAVAGVLAWGAADPTTPAAWSNQHPAPGLIATALTIVSGFAAMSLSINRVRALMPARWWKSRLVVGIAQWPMLVLTALLALATCTWLLRLAA